MVLTDTGKCCACKAPEIQCFHLFRESGMGEHWANHNVCFFPAIGWEDPPGCSTWEGCKGAFGKEIVATKGKSLTKKYIYQILYPR